MSEDLKLSARKTSALKVLQLSDCHIKSEVDGELLGIKTRESFEAVLQDVKSTAIRPDIVVVSGDLAQDGSIEAYQYLSEALDCFDCPVRWFAGNHDNRRHMHDVVASEILGKHIDLGSWRLVFMDSLVPGAVYGHLSPGELDNLSQLLNEPEPENVLVCLHHHPVQIQSTWLDHIGLENREALFAITDQYPERVKGILWGHIHQAFESTRNNVKLMASPSTCIQFKPGSDTFALDEVAPGYRWLFLGRDGSIDTEVIRAEQYVYELDMNSDGY